MSDELVYRLTLTDPQHRTFMVLRTEYARCGHRPRLLAYQFIGNVHTHAYAVEESDRALHGLLCRFGGRIVEMEVTA